jgi:hypothetical protein
MKAKIPRPKGYQRARIALQLCGINCDEKQAWRIMRCIRKYEVLKGKFSLDDAVKIIVESDNKFKQ